MSKIKQAIICDIDGTIAIKGDRSPYDWKRVGIDTVNMPVYDVLEAMRNDHKAILMLSGRDSICRPETENWLKEYSISYDGLFMRSEGDNRKDLIIKKELYENNIKNKYDVLFVLDDRNQVVKMWREEGLTCFQVAEGDF